MARKFNIGRQGEQLLNEEWHSLFMSLKYLNYNRYKNVEEEDINPERQTNIPDHALKLQKERGADILKAFYPTYGSNGEWKPIFDRYYHPANTQKPDDINNVVDYQLCIDPESGAIMYWDPSQRSWLVARAQEYNGELASFNGLNFQFISDLEQAKNQSGANTGFFPVPYVKYGKLFASKNLNNIFDRGYYVNISDYSPETGEIIDNNYSGVNGCAITIHDDSLQDLSWVHINASRLTNIDKRLIETPKDGYINISSIQTEFYGFKADSKNMVGGNRLGTLLIRGNKESDLDNGYDFINVVGGIQLSKEIYKDKKYDFIYALTYIFDDYPSNYGYVTTGMSSVGQNYQIYIGNKIEAPISLFLDGLALEKTNEFGETIYSHNPNEGVITFSDEEDADIINNMQMAVLAFPKKSEEFLIVNGGSGVIVNEGSVTVKVTIDIIDGNTKGVVPGYIQPMVFCSGIGLQETTIFEDFTVNEVKYNSSKTQATITLEIKDLKLPNEPIKGFIADIGHSFISKGALKYGETEYHEEIKADIDYVVFINGLLLTPTNGDMSIRDGYIQIMNAEDTFDTYTDYIVMEIDNNDDNKIGLVYDDTVSYYSVRIDDGGDKAVYNDCNDAVVYIENGIILDQAAIERPLNAVEGYYKANQIIRVPVDDNNSSYKYYKYDYSQNDPEEITDKDKIELIEYMIGYYTTTGSIHLLGNDKGWEGCAMSYYAYSYANTIDEPLTYGRRYNLAIPINLDNELQIYEGNASRFDAWNINCESLSTYINGLIIENKEIDDNYNGLIRNYELKYPKFNIPTDKEYYGKDAELHLIFDQMYNKYKEIKDKKEENINYSLSFETIIDGENIIDWPLIGKTVRNYFRTELLAKEALQLAVYINEDMQNESTSYVIERLERDEFQSAYRDFIYLDVGEGKDHGQIFKTINDTIEVDFNLAPSTLNVYQNGVLLKPSDYCRFNNNKIMFNVDVCGLQQLPDLDNMMKSIPDHVTIDVINELQNKLYLSKNVLRIIEDTAYYIPTSNRDTILIEKREDTSIRTVTYEVLTSSYKTYEFTQDYYDIPESLLNTADYIKIYINGVRYEGEYILTRTGGVKGIKLLESNCLVIDPLYEYFNRHFEELENYKKTYNKDYIRQKDEITFEWR